MARKAPALYLLAIVHGFEGVHKMYCSMLPVRFELKEILVPSALGLASGWAQNAAPRPGLVWVRAKFFRFPLRSIAAISSNRGAYRSWRALGKGKNPATNQLVTLSGHERWRFCRYLVRSCGIL